MISTPGIKSVLLCTAGTLATTPTNPVYIGIGDKSKLAFAPYKETKDSKNRTLRNMMSAQLDVESLQPTLKMFNSLLTLMNLNADVQVITDKQSAVADSEDVFKFNSASFKLGYGFELYAGKDKRSLKVNFKGAAPHSTVKALIDSADTEVAKTLVGITHPGGEDWTLQRGSNLLIPESPITTSLFALGEEDDCKLSIKAKTEENANGQLIVIGFNCRLEIITRDASIDNIVAQMNKAENSSVLVKMMNSDTTYDAFDFNAGVLSSPHSPEISDDKRNISMVFEGDIRPYDVTLETGADNGGADADEGLNGGTLKIGY